MEYETWFQCHGDVLSSMHVNKQTIQYGSRHEFRAAPWRRFRGMLVEMRV